jgi:hypothetical protein
MKVPVEYCRQTNGTPGFLCDDTSFLVLSTWDGNPVKQQMVASVTANCRSTFIMNSGYRIYICNGWLEKEEEEENVDSLYTVTCWGAL